MSVLDTLRASGLTVTADGDRLIVTPASAITPELRQIIRDNKPVILDALADDRRHCRQCQNLNGTRCRVRGFHVMDDLPRRCFDYLPTANDHDQSPGRDRWPSMKPEA